MGVFTSQLNVVLCNDTSHEGRGAWQLTEPLTYDSSLTGKTYTVPSKFITDFASVPRIPVLFDLFGDSAHEAATLHDWLYSTGAEPRQTCDKLFFEAMISTGISEWKSQIMYIAVRSFGWLFYKK